MIPSVVINLDRHPDRLKWFMENARRVKLTVERIEAVDAFDQSLKSQFEPFLHGESTLTYAEVACTMSHRKAWKMLLDSQAPYLAVFEDDVHLSSDISNFLVTNLVPEGVNLIKIEFPLDKVSYVHKRYATFNGRSLHRLITKAYGSAGYIVSRSCARRLLEVTESSRVPVDHILFSPQSVIWKEFILLQTVPALCIQDHVLSKLNRSSVQFESAIAKGKQDTLTLKNSGSKKRNNQFGININSMRRYISCVLKGANPLRYRNYIPFNLEFPGKAE
ncbi:MAG: hypothetical protein CVU66_02545 [Deltaproteobacteria bacterium HGW-Deltaproteobacteria-23]|nr:MAG: hypothetical protein CVU66_02545 [Deltaproteobacteria bacterium HGW-Deltaproteobacteria-23]